MDIEKKYWKKLKPQIQAILANDWKLRKASKWLTESRMKNNDDDNL